MSAEQNGKIESAVARCVEECLATNRPYARVSQIIAGLQSDPSWNFEEINELQTRLARLLLNASVRTVKL
jgi:hypothetical protein